MATCVLDGRTRIVASAAQTVFTFTFDADNVDDGDVVLWFEDVSAGTPGAEATQGVGAGQFAVDRAAKTCTLVTAAEVNDIITMERHQSSPVRKTTFTNPDDFIPSVVNDEFDHFLELLADLGRDRCRSIRMDRGVDLASLNVELPVPVAGEAWRWNSAATGIEHFTPIGDIGDDVVTLCFGDDDDYCLVYDSVADALEIRNEAGTPLITIKDNSNVFAQNSTFSGTLTATGTVTAEAVANAAVIIYEKTNVVGQSGSLIFDLENSISSRVTYAEIRGEIVTNSQGAIDGRLDLIVKDNGGNFTIARFNGADNLTTIFGDLTVDGASTLTGNVAIAGTLASGALTVTGKATISGALFITEQASATVHVAGDGQYWVKTANPNEPWFDGDTGVERQLIQGTGNTVTSLKVPIFDGTTGGLLKESILVQGGTTIMTCAGIVLECELLRVGNRVTLLASNLDNTNPESHAMVRARVAGASAGDPHFSWEIIGLTPWSMGFDNSDSDNFVLSRNQFLGTDNVFEIDNSAGNFTIKTTLTVDGASTLTGNVAIAGTLASGNMAVTGTLSTSGLATLESAVVTNDITIDGSVLLGASGVNKMWSAWIPAEDWSIATAAPLATITYQAGDVQVPVIAFDKDSVELIQASIMLPRDYDGSVLTFSVYWTCNAGTTGGVIWRGQFAMFLNDDTLALITATSTFTSDAFIAQKDLHVIEKVIMPTGAANGSRLLTIRFERAATSDDFDADAQFIGMLVDY